MLSKATKPLLFLLCLLPLALIVTDGFSGELGANPVEEITHRTGDWTLWLLLITLAITPLRRLSGYAALVRVRRMLGLFSFFYVSLHLLTYVWLDAYFSLDYIIDDIVDRLYITVGFASFLTMLPLAATSTNAMVRRLGPSRWRNLHRIVYATAIGGCLHYLWLVKADLTQPLIYMTLLGVLLIFRIPKIATSLSMLRAKSPAAKATPSLRSTGDNEAGKLLKAK